MAAQCSCGCGDRSSAPLRQVACNAPVSNPAQVFRRRREGIVRWIGRRNGAVTARSGSEPLSRDRPARSRPLSPGGRGPSLHRPENMTPHTTRNPLDHDAARVLLGEAGDAYCESCGDAVRFDPRVGIWRTVARPGPTLPRTGPAS